MLTRHQEGQLRLKSFKMISQNHTMLQPPCRLQLSVIYPSMPSFSQPVESGKKMTNTDISKYILIEYFKPKGYY